MVRLLLQSTPSYRGLLHHLCIFLFQPLLNTLSLSDSTYLNGAESEVFDININFIHSLRAKLLFCKNASNPKGTEIGRWELHGPYCIYRKLDQANHNCCNIFKICEISIDCPRASLGQVWGILVDLNLALKFQVRAGPGIWTQAQN